MQQNLLNLISNLLNFALIISFILSILSGLAMSKYALPFLNGFVKIATARSVHLTATHWFFIFASLHTGFHALKFAKFANKSKLINALFIAMFLISIYGFYLFLDTGMIDYMLGNVQFAFLDFKAPLWQSMISNALMLLSWTLIGFLLANFLQNLKDEK